MKTLEKKHICDGGDDYGLVDCLRCEKKMLSHLKLKKDIGDDLFYSLSEADKQFILDTEGSVDLGYAANKDDLKNIFSSIKKDL